MNVLVTGATSGYGLGIVRALRTREDTVTMLQRVPADKKGMKCIICNLLDETDMLNALATMVDRDWTYDAVVHSAAMRDEVTFESMQSFQMIDHFSANCMAPMLLTRYLHRFGRLKDNAKVVLLLDNHTGRNRDTPYIVSKAALQALAYQMARNMSMPVNSVQCPLPTEDDAKNRVTNAVLSLLDSKNALTGQTLDC